MKPQKRTRYFYTRNVYVNVQNSDLDVIHASSGVVKEEMKKT